MMTEGYQYDESSDANEGETQAEETEETTAPYAATEEKLHES